MLFKKKNIEINGAGEYRQAMETFQTMVSELPDTERYNLADYFISVISKDIAYDLLSTILYTGTKMKRDFDMGFPWEYYDEYGTRKYFNNMQERVIDFSTTTVLTLPWNIRRMPRSVRDISGYGLLPKENYFTAVYYPLLNICEIGNGKHHSAAAFVQNQGFIVAGVKDLSELFEHISTDGQAWINVHTGKQLEKIGDFRVAVLYSIAKIKYESSIKCCLTDEEEIMLQKAYSSVKQCPICLKTVQTKLKTYALCYTAMVDAKSYEEMAADILSYVPMKFRDYKMCLAAVTASGRNLMYVPSKIVDLDICAIALKTANVMEYVPLELQKEVMDHRIQL